MYRDTSSVDCAPLIVIILLIVVLDTVFTVHEVCNTLLYIQMIQYV